MRKKKSYKWPNKFYCSGQMVLDKKTISDGFNNLFPDEMKIAKLFLYLRMAIIMNFPIIDPCQFSKFFEKWFITDQYHI